MSGARTIEVQDDPIRHVFCVRLRDGDQVLATREFSERDLMLDGKPRRAWETAREMMRGHDQFLEHSSDGSDAAAAERWMAQQCFNAAIHLLFPEFGTVPDGVETTT